jgi:hypothetical protein
MLRRQDGSVGPALWKGIYTLTCIATCAAAVYLVGPVSEMHHMGKTTFM